MPDPDGPGPVTPDWMDEAEWQRYCAGGDEDPPGEDEELCLDPAAGSLEGSPRRRGRTGRSTRR